MQKLNEENWVIHETIKVKIFIKKIMYYINLYLVKRRKNAHPCK